MTQAFLGRAQRKAHWSRASLPVTVWVSVYSAFLLRFLLRKVLVQSTVNDFSKQCIYFIREKNVGKRLE